MSTYYSIIFASIRPEIGEKITVGLLVLSAKDSFLSISKSKLSIAKMLLEDELYQGLKNELEGIQQTFDQYKNTENFSSKSNSLFDKSYINYLSNYKNNVLNFTRVKKIEVEADREVFDSLYLKFIDSKGDKIELNNKIYSFEKI